ncbi:MAG: PAS domain S-box protein [Cyclobacteriaceae bacterium]|nr:PAS domain S-box protein [Cyclobacteriaceae bacterium]
MAQVIEQANYHIDSLQQQLHHAHDSLRVDLLNLLAYNYYYYRNDSTAYYASKALELALQLDYKKGVAEAQRLIGIAYKAKNDEETALEWLFQGLETSRSISYDQGIADNLNSIGIFFATVNDHEEAITYFKESLIYQKRAKNKLREGLSYSNIAESMLKSNQLDSSYFYFNKSELIMDSIQDPRWIAMIKSRFAKYWYVSKAYEKAKRYAQSAIELSIATNQTIHHRNASHVLAQVYLDQGQLEKARQHADKTLELSTKIGFIAYLTEAYDLQYKLKKAWGQYPEALAYHEKFSSYRDSLRRDQIVSESNLVRFQMKLLQKEKENVMLRKEKENSDAQAIADQTLIRRQTLIVIAILVILFLVTVLAVVFFRSRQKEREVNAELLASNASLEDQKEELSATLQMVEHLNAQLQAQNNTLNKMAIVSITDLEGNIISINKNFCDVSGFSRDELQGANHRLLNSGEHPIELFSQMWQSISSGNTWRGELKNKRKNGEFFWTDTAIAPIFNDEGKPKQYFSLQFDITERKNYLTELSKKSAELEELNKLKDKLLSIISHDFRGPLNSLRGMLTLFLQGALSNEELSMLTESLAEKLDITYNLLENLLHWAKSQMQGMKVYARHINLHAISTDCFDLLGPVADKKLVKMENKIKEPVMVYADNEMIKLVLRNLISNAIKFTSAGNKIELDATQRKDQVVVSIKDNGTGISNENQSKMFKLENYSTSGTSNETGMGLGLLLCKDFVEKNHGTIWFESELGKGSTFYFALPATKEAAQL